MRALDEGNHITSRDDVDGVCVLCYDQKLLKSMKDWHALKQHQRPFTHSDASRVLSLLSAL
jgi:hypothetical protein